jgi:uncharacterized protein (TIGR03545 family)
MKKETAKKQKPGKAPGSLKKPIEKNKFEKKYAKYIEHPQDKQFFKSCFELKDSMYTIRGNLTKDDVKKLNNLLKVIKGNKKGAVKLVPIAFAAIITAAVIIFFAVFANPLLEKAMEIGLEVAFEARSDVDNLRLSLIPLRISIAGVTVANRDSPMTNLFQMGKTIISLKTQAVLRGKIYIEEIRADSLRFGTARKFSGALPAKPAKVKAEKPKSDAPPLIDLKNFDAMALLNQEFDKLNTPKLYDEAITTYNETASKWQGRVDSSSAKVKELNTVAQPLLNLNVNSIRDVETIRSTIQNINNAVSSVQSATSEVTEIVGGLENDINTARRMETNARNSLTADLNHLKSYIDLGSGAAFASIEPFIRDALSDTANQYLDYGIMALEVFEKLRAKSASKPKEEKPKKEKKVVFKGRDVYFPTVSYPAFYLGVLASDFTIDAWNWAFDLRNISSDPDLTYKLDKNKPAITLDFGMKEETGSQRRNVSFNGSADLRTDAKERFKAEAVGKGFSVNLEEQLSALGVDGLKGESDFSVNMAGQVDGGFSGGGNVIIKQAALVNPSGTIAEAIDIAIRQAGNINLGMQYIHKIDQNDEFKITSNIADLFARALRSTAEAYAKNAVADLEKALRQKVDQYIDGRLGSKDQVDTILKTVRGDRTAIDQMKKGLDTKKAELEQKLKSQATDAAGQAVRDALPSNLPSLPGVRR